MVIMTSSFLKSSVFKMGMRLCFPSTLKREDGVFKFFLFEEHFRKAPFLREISADGRPKRRKRELSRGGEMSGI